jgi:hypothetical protein
VNDLTLDDIRGIVGDAINALSREFHRDLKGIDKKLDVLQQSADDTNGRVTALERLNIMEEAAEVEREKMVAAAMHARNRRKGWYLAWAAILIPAIGLITTATALLAHYITHK